MRLILAAPAFRASLAAAYAEETFGGRAFDRWSLLQWSSGLPVLKARAAGSARLAGGTP